MLWQQEWQQQGFPEELSEALCQEVLDAISTATTTWSDTGAHDLTWMWCEVVEQYAADPLHHAQAMWAFALWGRSRLYDLLDEIEDVDKKLYIEKQYLDLLYELPVAKLIDRLEHLHRAVPPDAPLPEVPIVTDDRRQPVPQELVRSAYDHSTALY